MKCILTSVNYGDYLEATSEYTSKTFDEVIVVTIKSDKHTIKVCNKYKNYTAVIVSNDEPFYNPVKGKKSSFNKGHLLNQGIKYLEKKGYKGYICIADGDTTFSSDFVKIFNNFKKKLKQKLPEADPSRMLFGAPRYIAKSLPDFKKFMEDQDASCKRKNGKWIGIKHNIFRKDNEAHERLLLGYCQIFYIDTELKEKIHRDSSPPFYYQADNLSTTMQVDAKFIGKFKNSKLRLNWVKKDKIIKEGKVFPKSGKGTCEIGFNFECIKNKDGMSHLWGCHIEDPSFFCIHLGSPWINAKGRVTTSIL